jgi:PGF-pre-PGF domain-containing protein
MNTPDIEKVQAGKRCILQTLRCLCLFCAVMMIMSVSVHPAMAQMEAKEKIDTANATIAQLQQMGGGTSCSGCGAGLANETLPNLMSRNGVSLTITQIPLDGEIGSAPVDGAETHSAGNVTITVNTEDWKQKFNTNMPVGMMDASGTSRNTSAMGNWTEAERLAEFDNDPLVLAHIKNVTERGFTDRTTARVERYGYRYNVTNSSFRGTDLSTKPTMIDVARYEYTNATGFRYKFYATQRYAVDGTPVPPRDVIVGAVYPPAPKERDLASECRWQIIALVLAVIVLLTAMAIALGITIASIFAGAGMETPTQTISEPGPPIEERVPYKIKVFEGETYFGHTANEGSIKMDMYIWRHRDVPGNPGYGTKLYWDYIRTQVANEDLYLQNPDIIYHPGALTTITTINWGLGILQFVAIVLATVLVGGILITLALGVFSVALFVLMQCMGMVEEASDYEYLEFRLNPEGWNWISEKDNGGMTYVPVSRPNEIVVMLNESVNDSVRSVWNLTSMNLNSTELFNPNDNSSVRIWTFMAGTENPTIFSARYVREDDPAGPAEKEFMFTILPMTWTQPDTGIDHPASSLSRYGTSIAVDQKTDRMHIAYLTVDDPGKPTRGQLMYSSGIGSHWDRPVVVDDIGYLFDWTVDTTVSVNHRDELEMARTTSIALDPDGNPAISYRDNNCGSLKYARLLTAKNAARGYEKGVSVRNGWMTETVDGTSQHSGWGSSLAIDRDGNPHIAYLWQGGWEWGLNLKYAHWNGNAWNIQTLRDIFPRWISSMAFWQHNGGNFGVIQSNIDRGESPSIALDSAGLPHISIADYVRRNPGESNWYNHSLINGRSCRNNYDLLHIFELPDGSWVTESVDPAPAHPDAYTTSLTHFIRFAYSSIALDSHDRPHISYFNYWDEVCNYQATWGTYAATDQFSWFLRPPIWGNCHYMLGGLKYAYWNGSAWNAENVDTSSIAVGEYTSLKIDPNDHPQIAYMDVHNGLIRYATRDQPGTRWSRFIPFKAGKKGFNSGGFTSLDLDARGNPRIVGIGGESDSVQVLSGQFDEPGPATARSLAHGNTTSGSDPAEMSTPSGEEISPSYPGGSSQPVEVHPFPLSDQDRVEDDSTLMIPGNEATASHGSITAVPAAAAGQTVTYALGTPSSSNAVAVHSISFEPGHAIPNSMAWARQESPLSSFRLQNVPAAYENIGVSVDDRSAISSARIAFSVTKDWLDTNNVDPANVVMMHQHDSEWTELPTTFDRQEGDRYYYTATTPGFSYFAVTDKTTVAALKNKVTVTVTPTVGNNAAPAAEAVPAVTKSSVKGYTKVSARSAQPGPKEVASEESAATVPASEPVSGLPLLWIAVAALVSMLGVAGFFIGRRMWWAHQNPALFRKYD